MSGLTVLDLMALPAMSGSQVAAGRTGLDRQVSGVNVMEVPDIEAFVRPGEVLLTTAYPLRDRVSDLPHLIEALHRSGLAALAVKLGRYLDHLPEAALRRADELGFPVLVVPDNLSFNEVITSVFTVLLADEGAAADHTEAIRERLTRVALAGGGLDDIARTLAIALTRSVRLAAGGVHYACDADGAALDWPEGDHWTETPILVAGVVRGRLEVEENSRLSVTQHLLLKQASFAAALHVAQAQAAAEFDERMRILFLEDLVSGRGETDHAILRERARLYALDLDGPRTVVFARVAREVDTAQVSRLAESLGTGESVVWSRGTEVVALVRAVRPMAWAAAWQQSLDGLAGETRVAVGSVVHHLAHVARSHAEARDAVAIAEVRGVHLASHQGVAVERLLLGVGPAGLADLVDSQLGELEAVDGVGGPLSATLEAYLGHGNGALAGRELNVHYNTMKHRLRRIAAILDADLTDPPTRLALQVALAARRVLTLSRLSHLT